MGVRGRKPKRDRSVVPAGTWFPAYMNARMECTSGLASRGGTAAVQGLAGQEKRKSARAISSGRRWRALGTRELSSGLCLAIVLPYLRPCSRYVRSQSACVKLCWQVGAALLLQGFRFEQVNEQRQEKPRRRVNLAPECIAGKMNRHEAGGGPRGLGTNCEWAGARGGVASPSVGSSLVYLRALRTFLRDRAVTRPACLVPLALVHTLPESKSACSCGLFFLSTTSIARRIVASWTTEASPTRPLFLGQYRSHGGHTHQVNVTKSNACWDGEGPVLSMAARPTLQKARGRLPPRRRACFAVTTSASECLGRAALELIALKYGGERTSA